MWKYVSPRRRRVGLLLLALLVTLLYAGWYFTRSSHIRREAKRTLENLTGADVDVDEATFSVFEGIRLFNVRVRIRGEEEHFFTAEELVLKHRPGVLIFRRRIEPTEIVCLRPVVNLEYENGDSNAERLFRLASSQQRSGGEGEPTPLPRIRVKDGLLRTRVKRKGRTGPVVEEQFTASLKPKNSHLFEVTVQGRGRGGGNIEWARLELDVSTGAIRPISGSATERWFVHMPPEYRKWIDRYDFRGDFTLLEGEHTDPEQGRYEIELDDFSMKLPPPEGDLTLTDVRGKLRFTKQYVEMHEITGRLEEAGRAVFTLNGRYEGYAKDSPFHVKIGITNLRFPRKIRGPLQKTVDVVRRDFQPEGVGAVTMTFRRDMTGRNLCEGRLEPQNAKMTYRRFPLPVEDVCGAVYFTQTGPNRIAFTARRGEAKFTINGELRRDAKAQKTLYDIRVSGKNVSLDAAARGALPKQYHKVWDTLCPSGACDVDVHVVKNKPRKKAVVNVDFHMTGHTNIAFKTFPYPLTHISGEAKLRGRDVHLLNAVSQNGRMLVHAKGDVKGLATKDTNVNFQIQASHVPIDEMLLRAVKGKARTWLEELQPGGELLRVDARVAKRGGNPTDYDITTVLKDASFCYTKFPYAVDHAEGEIRITPAKTTFREIQGRHGNATVVISGSVELRTSDAPNPAYDLSIRAKDVTLGKEFHDALPPNLREVWKSLTPSGRADIDVAMKSIGDQTPPDYLVAVNAKDASLRYRDFPYTFRHVKGKAVVTPGVVTLETMQARDGTMQADVSGVIRHAPDGAQDVVLRVSAKHLPIDENMLAAIPTEVVPLAKRIGPGGNVSAEIQKLQIRRPPRSTTQPGATTAPADPPPVSWTAEGDVTLHDVVMDIGFGPRKLTGRIAGLAGREAKDKLHLDAQAELARLAFKKHVISDLKGRLIKRPDSDTLQIEKATARAHDGKIDGEMSIRLRDPIQYELSASIWNVNMAKLVNVGEPDPKKWVKLDGMLSGRLSLEAIGGKHPQRQATGELTVSRGHMFELPVILGLANVIYLQLPSESAFNRGFMNYHLRNDVLRFDEIYLTGWDRKTNMGKGISILGSGKMNMKNEKLDLTFLTGPPGDLPRLDEITEDILEALSRSLVEIRVTGTLKKPKMDTVPLSPLATIIRRLLEPSRKTQ